MANKECLDIHLKDLERYFPAISSDDLAEDIFISRISNGNKLATTDRPFRLDGYLAYFCIEGDFKMEINLRMFHVSRGTLLLSVPGNIISLTGSKGIENSRFVALAVSRRILQNAKVDLSRLFDQAMSFMLNPCIQLQDNDIDICRGYYRLSEKLIEAAHPNLEASLMDLGLSLFHYLGSLWVEKPAGKSTTTNSTLRSKMVFERFMKLVAENHVMEHEVGFYADKLSISPKYLSQLVKKISGQSAPDWISSFVILEAKNYLKYSNLDVKEIAYKLYFSSTPVFFRYFKAHTGLTPLEYRKS